MSPPTTTTGRRVLQVPLTADQRRVLDAALFDPNVTEIAMGGARGTVKTFAACAITMAWLLQNPGEQAMVLRLTEKAAVGNITKPFRAVAELFGIRVRYHVQRSEFYLPNGSEFHIRHCSGAAAYKPQQGQEYGLIWVEEATQFQREAYQLLGGTRRARRPGVKAVRLATANPGEIGEEWFCERFVNEATRKRGVLFVNSELFDSLPTLERNPGYFDEELKLLPEHQQAWWVKGQFGVRAGTFFAIPPSAVQEVRVPFHATWHTGHDWGHWPDPYAVMWAAKWRDGNTGRDRIHFAMELGGYRWEPDVQAQKTLAREKKAFDDGFVTGPVRSRFADAQAFRRQETESTEFGKTIARMWAKHKMPVKRPRTMSRVAGWTVMKMLMDPRYGVLTVDPRCESFLNEMAFAVQGDPGTARANEIHDKCADHFLRAGAWILVSTFSAGYRPRPVDAWEKANRGPVFESKLGK